MEKLKVNKKEYKVLKWIEDNYPNIGEYFDLLVSSSLNGNDNTDALGKRNVGHIINAFVFGYEIEKTKETKLLELFQKNDYTSNNSVSHIDRICSEYFKQGMLETLEIIDIEIEGINI